MTTLIPHRTHDTLVLRGPTHDDLQPITDLLNLTSVALIGKPDFTVEALRHEWETPGFSPAEDIRLLYSPAGELIAYAEVWDSHQPPVQPWFWFRIHPDYERDEAIGDQLMAWAEEHAQHISAAAPEHLRLALRSSIVNSYDAGRALLERYGMTTIRHFWQMEIELDKPLPAPQWPAAVTLRPFDPARDSRTVYQAIQEAFRDHWGHIEASEEEGFQQWCHFTIESDDFDPSIWFVAMEGEEIAGVSLCRPRSDEDERMGWLSQLGVRRPWRAHGLGLALLHHTFGEFQRRGQARVGLRVDASSLTGATRLYERAGMHVSRQMDAYERELRPGERLQ